MFYYLHNVKSVILSDNKVIEFFYMADDLCIFYKTIKGHSIKDKKKNRL